LSDESPFYVYLLLRKPVSKLGISKRYEPKNILYVGKGKGYRWKAHFGDAPPTTNADDTDLIVVPGAKRTAIIKALGDDPTPELIEQHVLIVAGGMTENEAFRLEAIVLQLVGGLDVTENKVLGHFSGELLVPAAEARVFFGAEDLAVDTWKVRGTGPLQSDLLAKRPKGAVVFLVKGTARSLDERVWTGSERSDRLGQAVTKDDAGVPPIVRRGWDPRDPWTPDEAWTRARKYWSGSAASIELWQQLISQRGGYLALLVPDPRDGRSVVRDVWKLDPKGLWEDYPTFGNKFGFPSGDPVLDHPWLGKRLVESSTNQGVLRSPNAPAVTLWK